MCCKIDSSVVVFEEGEEEKVFYKVVAALRYAPFYYQTYNKGVCVLSNRPSTDFDEDELQFQEIAKGIHVLLHKKDAEKLKQYLSDTRKVNSDNFTIISVKASKQDLVGAGYWIDDAEMETAVFMKVTVLD